MPGVEAFPVIDVLPAPEAADAHAPKSEESRGRAEPPRATLALWPGPARSAEIVVHRGAARRDVHCIGLPAVLDDRFVMLREPESARARSYRLLRHRLLALADPRIVAVTSARSGEGKTSCGLNLAFALAEDAMVRVLLLEANLRRPILGRLFGFDPEESIVENIVRYVEVGPPYPVTSIAGTRVDVAALPTAPLPDARLDRTLFAGVLCDLRTAYDYIVIDAGSVLESADADVVGECSSGVVLTARAGRSRATDLRRAASQLSPASVLGTVLLDS